MKTITELEEIIKNAANAYYSGREMYKFRGKNIKRNSPEQ